MKVLQLLPISFLLLAVAALLAGGSRVMAAYPEWADDGFGGSACSASACHGDFRQNNYTSKSDGTSWGTSLMSGHLNFISGGCDVCHAGGFSPVFLNVSDGQGGLAPISCLGCHGREEGSGVTGAGLRQHHWNNGITVCGNAGCHPNDSNPAVFTTVSEIVLPPYYANPGSYTAIPEHPCNLQGYGYSEDLLNMALGGLDNDGDNVYDTNDTDCASLVATEESTWGRIKALYK